VIRQITSLSSIDSHREQNGKMREREIACAVSEDSPNRRKIESLVRRPDELTLVIQLGRVHENDMRASTQFLI